MEEDTNKMNLATTPLDTGYEELQQRLRRFDKRVLTIHDYWQNIEVILTRALVTEDCRLEGNLYWNIPFQSSLVENKSTMGVLDGLWQKYIQELQRRKQQATTSRDGNNALFPALSVTPDAHTWMAWALTIPDKGDKGGTDSPYSSVLLGQPLKYQQGHPRYIYTLGDLKAIVQQSHHCAASLRHLLQMFVVEREDKKTGSTTMSSSSSSSSDGPYTADLRGNHKYTYRRVREHTPLVEKLVAHAIRQQMLMITPTVHAHLKHVWQLEQATWHDQSAHGRIYGEEEGEVGEEPPAKRQKPNIPRLSDLSLTLRNDKDAADLWRACRVVLLRTWATRHAAVLAPLFQSEPWSAALALLHLDPKSVTKHLPAVEKAKAQLDTSDSLVGKGDLSLDHIDSAILSGEYDDSDQLTLTVGELVTAWRRVQADEIGGPCPLLEVARRDWVSVNQHLTQIEDSKGIVHAARSLVDDDTPSHILPDNIESWCDVLLSCPTPWGQACGDCKMKTKQQSKLLPQSCATCGQWRHSHCSQGKFVRTESFIDSFEPLRSLFAARCSEPPAAPVSWKRMEFVLERHRDENTGELPKLGLVLSKAKRCADLLKRLVDHEILPWRRNDFNGLVPLQVDRSGFVIISFSTSYASIAMEAGLQEGDVIVAVEMLEFDRGKSGEKMTPQSFDIQEHNSNDVMVALRLPCIKFRFVVERPDKNPIPASRSFWKASLDSARLSTEAYSKLPELLFCSNCHEINSNLREVSTGAAGSLHIHRLCRAVVRHLASQHFAQPFCYENHVEIEKLGEPFGDIQCVSLKRLDLLYTAMIQGKDVEKDRLSPLYVRCVRLSWTTENLNPMRLLCQGIALMVGGQSGHNVTDSARQYLLIDFTRYFAAWCLSSSVEYENACVCPPFALCRTLAWKSDLCRVCGLRDEQSNGKVCSICQGLGLLCSGRPQQYNCILRSYEEKAAVVGCMVALLPDDDVVKKVAPILERNSLPIEHFGRPVEFLVTAYIPSGLENGLKNYEENDFGSFFLLPIVQPTQLTYLVDRCRLEDSDGLLTSAVLQKWYKNGLLDLEGVVKISHTELLKKLKCTSKIVAANRERVEIMNAREGTENFERVSSADDAHPVCFEQDRSAFRRTVIEANRKLVTASGASGFVSRAISLMKPQIPTSDTVDDFNVDTDAIFVPAEDFPLVSTASEENLNQFLLSIPTEDPKMIMYSDLFFNSIEAKALFENEHHFNDEEEDFTSSAIRTIVLDHTNARSSFRAFANVGWGFELFMEDDGVPRVGRVDKAGIAFQCGLRRGDKILHINGKNTKTFYPFIEFPKALMCCPMRNLSPNRTAFASLLVLYECSKADKKPGPLVLKICRRYSSSEISLTQWTSQMNTDGSRQHAISEQHPNSTVERADRLSSGTTQSNKYARQQFEASDGANESMNTDIFHSSIAFDQQFESVETVETNFGKATKPTDYAGEEIEAFFEANEGTNTNRFLENTSAEQRSESVHCDTVERHSGTTTGPNDCAGQQFKARVGTDRVGFRGLSETQTGKRNFHITDDAGERLVNYFLQKGILNSMSTADEILDSAGFVMERVAGVFYHGRQIANEQAKHALQRMISKSFLRRYQNEILQQRTSEHSQTFALQHKSVAAPQQPVPPPQPARCPRLVPDIQGAPPPSRTTIMNQEKRIEFSHLNYKYLIDRMDFDSYRLKAPPLAVGDLYVCGPAECSMTMAELSVLLRAILEKQPMLGFRLLMPRYRIRIIEEHFNHLTRLDLSQFRSIPETHWKALLRLDYQRASTADAGKPQLLVDPTFKYVISESPFSIDNFFEAYFKRNAIPDTTKIIEIDQEPPDRIRGGGKTEEPVPLNSRPANEWPGKTVYARIIVASDGTQKVTTIIGDVVSICDASRGKVRLKVYFHIKKGVVDPYEIDLEAKDLYEVQLGSKKWEKAQQAKKHYKILHSTSDATRDDTEPDVKMTEADILPNVTIDEVLRHPFFRIIRMNGKERLKEVLRSIDSTNQPFVLMGLLPDHRSIYWHILDGNALYITPWPATSGEEKVIQFLDRLDAYDNFQNAHTGVRPHHICNWNCGKQDTKNRVFDNRNDLLDHNHAQHDIPSDGTLWKLVRVSSVETIRNLVQALVAIVYRRFYGAIALWAIGGGEPTLSPIFVTDGVPASEEHHVARSWAVAKIAEKEAFATLVNMMTLFDTDNFCCRLSESEEVSHGELDRVGDGDSSAAKISDFDLARRLLLSLAETTPDQLLTLPKKDQSDRIDHTLSLVSFISSCQTVKGLIHAFNYIIYSTNIEFMPGWWKSNGGGWSSAQGLLLNPLSPKLLLHIQVFKEAISEATQLSASGRAAAFKRLKLRPFPSNYVDLTKEMTSMAKAKGIPMWLGESDDFCYACRDGGDLYM